MNKKKDAHTIICRCQDITLEEVEAAIESGVTDPEELKRFLHIGMGPCQGRTCGKLVMRILSARTGIPQENVGETTRRPPLITVPMHELFGAGDE